MQTKLLEIRDKATFIPALAIQVSGADGYIMRRAGFGDPLIILIHLQSMECHHDPYDWSGSRTMRNAHLYIQEHWSILERQVIDVEYILGETMEPKVSEQFGG